MKIALEDTELCNKDEIMRPTNWAVAVMNEVSACERDCQPSSTSRERWVGDAFLLFFFDE